MDNFRYQVSILNDSETHFEENYTVNEKEAIRKFFESLPKHGVPSYDYPEVSFKFIGVAKDENSSKTRVNVFLELYPNAQVDNQGIPFIYPCDLDKTMRRKDGPCYKGCEECRAEFWMQKVE